MRSCGGAVPGLDGQELWEEGWQKASGAARLKACHHSRRDSPSLPGRSLVNAPRPSCPLQRQSF